MKTSLDWLYLDVSENDLNIDSNNIWHPYDYLPSKHKPLMVKKAKGIYIYLSDGRKLIDAVCSWWSTIFGHNHDLIVETIDVQSKELLHVMFAGLTHKPVIQLTKNLLKLMHPKLNKIFYSDSGSTSVEVALKMSIQYFYSKGKNKHRFICFENSYHGDTFQTMSISNNGMHNIFSNSLQKQILLPEFPDIKISPNPTLNEIYSSSSIVCLENVLKDRSNEIAALIVEPIIKGAAGFKVYSYKYLNEVIRICRKYDVLVIFDEIATGFGKTGKSFAYKYLDKDLLPDIVTLGKAITAGYINIGVTIVSEVISNIISNIAPFMHGPTFMANPLACSIAATSTSMFINNNEFIDEISNINLALNKLNILESLSYVKEVRIIGPIAIIEFIDKIDSKLIQNEFINNNIWLRPFSNIVYLMPPYIINANELKFVIDATINIINNLGQLISSKESYV